MRINKGYSVVGILLLVLFSLSIFLKPVHFIVIKHIYYGTSHHKTTLVPYHKDCPLEKEEVIQSTPPAILTIVVYELSKYKPFVCNYLYLPNTFFGNIFLRAPPSF